MICPGDIAGKDDDRGGFRYSFRHFPRTLTYYKFWHDLNHKGPHFRVAFSRWDASAVDRTF